jgi:hypothetical protein
MLHTPPRAGRLLGCLCLTSLLWALGWLVLPASCWGRLEPTAHAASISVINTNDSGPGSLRQAILDANASPGPDTISFDFSQPGINTISPASPLPVITDPLVINGLTPDGKFQVELDGSKAGANADGLFVNDNFAAGGNVTIEGLVINRFSGNGIVLSNTRLNCVEKNIIGTNAGMTADLGNGQQGILVNNSSSNVLTGNVIAANHGSGVMLTGSGATDNLLTKNQIGIASEAVTLGNQTGVSITGGANGNIIGNIFSFDLYYENYYSNNEIANNTGAGVLIENGEGNIVGANKIYDNKGAGVFVNAPAGAGSNSTLISHNSFAENGGLPIDLAPAGATANDPGDADTGANGLQNFPLLSNVKSSTFGLTSYVGTLNSTPNTKFNLEFYGGGTCDQSGHHDGGFYLISSSVTTGGNGNAAFSFSIPFQQAHARPGAFITATATDPSGNTSEFSPCTLVTESDQLSFDADPSPDFYHVNEGAGSITLKVKRTLSTLGTITVDYRAVSGTATAGVDFVPVQGTLVFNDGESVKSITVPILEDSLVEYPEDFFLVLSNTTGGATFVGYSYNSPSPTVMVGIMDNDTPPRIVYGLTEDNRLVSFTTNQPRTLLSNQRIKGEKLLGIDFRPATGELYGLGLSGHLYMVNRLTGELKQIGTDAIPNWTETIAVMDFDPVRDRLRVTGHSDPRNLQIDPNTGAVSSVDAPLSNGSNGFDWPELYALAYSNNYPGAPKTTAYGLNRFSSFAWLKLVTLGSPDGSPLSPDSGKLFMVKEVPVAPKYMHWAGFDITDTGEAYASTATYGVNSGTMLQRVNLEEAYARSIGIIGDPTQVVRDIAVEPTTGTNLIDNAGFFVHQQYLDFLNREPDAAGLAYWTNRIALCGDDAACTRERRIDVSAAFVIENEFQQTGSFIYRLYKGTLERRPTYTEFTAERSRITVGDALEASKDALVAEWVERPEFKTAYPDQMSTVDFVNKLFDTAGLKPYTDERARLIAEMQGGKTRAGAVREVIEMKAFKEAEYNPSFVLMQYFGYLHRDPEQAGYDFWLNILNNVQPNNYRAMVCAFITSAEYQHRFGQTSTHTNRNCAP